MKTNSRAIIKNVKRIVVKIGTSLLTTQTKTGYRIKKTYITNLIDSISKLHSDYEIVIVSSGAIGFGMVELKIKDKPKTIPLKQAAASIGQIKMVELYEKLLNKYKIKVSQILLTREILTNRTGYLNAYNAFQTLIGLGIIPVVNENDTVSVEEIKFGDNDNLGAIVANLVNADLLIILSDIDGLYNNLEDKNVIYDVKEITEKIEAIALPTQGQTTTGGMQSKIEAAKISATAGIPMIICSGREENILNKILSGKNIGTLFHPKKYKLKSRQRWIKFNLKAKGRIYVDSGAANALLKRKSLLPSGILKVTGAFKRGDCVSVYSIDKKNKICQGLVNYSDIETDKIKGKHSSKIAKELGYSDYDEVIHADNLVLYL